MSDSDPSSSPVIQNVIQFPCKSNRPVASTPEASNDVDVTEEIPATEGSQPADNGLPTIDLDDEFHDVLDQAMGAMAKHDPFIFAKGDRLVRVGLDGETPRLMPLEGPQLRVTAVRRRVLPGGSIQRQVVAHDEGDGSEVGGARAGVARERTFRRGVREEQGVQGVDAQLGGVAPARSRRVVAGSEFGASALTATEPAPSRRAERDTAVLAGRARPTVTAAVEMIVEIGAARIRVSRGFDTSLFGEVVRALGGAAR